MGKFSSLICALLFSLASAHLSAQDKISDVTEYSFNDTLVEGDLLVPNGTAIIVKKKSTTRSLVIVRPHYMPEMFKSAEDI